MDLNFSAGQVAAYLLFGLIGTAALMYGKKQGSPRAMALGAALAIYPYFVSSSLWLWLIGLALTAGLFFWTD